MVQLWGKIKSGYGTAFANLSLSSSEEDGDTESDTIIHNALVKYYMNQGQGIPTWLEAEKPVEQRPQTTRPPELAMRRSNTQSSSLQDIYNRHQRAPATVQGEYRGSAEFNPRFRPPPRSRTFDNSEPDSNQENRSDKFRNKLRSTRAQW